MKPLKSPKSSKAPKAPRRRVLRPQTLSTRREGDLWWAFTVVEGGGTRVEALLGSGVTEAEALAKVRKDWRTCCSISVRAQARRSE